MKFVDLISTMSDYVGSNGRSEEEILEAEKALNISFAEEYFEYLKKVGLACFDGHELTGLTKTKRLDVVTATKEQRMRSGSVTSSWYVVEICNIDDIIVWQDMEGKVFVTKPFSEVKKVANSLTEYVLL